MGNSLQERLSDIRCRMSPLKHFSGAIFAKLFEMRMPSINRDEQHEQVQKKWVLKYKA